MGKPGKARGANLRTPLYLARISVTDESCKANLKCSGADPLVANWCLRSALSGHSSHMIEVCLNVLKSRSGGRYTNMLYRHDSSSQRQTKLLIEAFDRLVKRKVEEGMKAYLVTFMFNQLPGNSATKIEIMQREIESVHNTLCRHIVRKLTSPNWRHLRPVFIAAPDRPVYKLKKASSVDASINDGLHYHAIVLVPPRRRGQPDRGVKVSRLKVGLRTHFREEICSYVKSRINRIHVQRIKHGTTCDYVLKSVRRNTTSYDDILVLN